MGSGGSALSAIATGSLLGFRNGLYGLKMAPLLKLKGFRRLRRALWLLGNRHWSLFLLESLYSPWSPRRWSNWRSCRVGP
jgi:predicted branched-subunit amino acid permease